jgi:hypothetical protein
MQAGAPNRVEVAVVMRREPVSGPMSRWQSWRWLLADVLTGEALAALDLPAVAGPLALEPAVGERVGQDEPDQASHWIYPGLTLELHPDDLEGYYLNLSSPHPCCWVMWRPDEAVLPDGSPAPLPQIATLSYHDAGRWLDAQERVEQVPAPAAVVAWLAVYVESRYRPEPKRRQRPASFQSLADRFGNPVSISTGDRRSRGRGGDAA